MNVQPWRWLAAMAAVYGLLVVLLAALGAHVVPLRDAAVVRMWNTALEMHLFHTMAMLGLAAIAVTLSSRAIVYSGLLFAAGTVLFSGSLYLRAAGADWFPDYLAPAGGMLLIAAWLWLVIIFFRKSSG